MTNRNTSLDGLMRDYGWAVHDFQRLASSISLLAASLDTSDDLDAPNFYSEIDQLTSPRQFSVSGQKIAAVMSDEDRAALRRLKKTRDDLVYRFFLDFKVDAQRGTIPTEAVAKLGEVQNELAEAMTVVERLYKHLAAA
jgi:hypothetical protein